MRFREIKLFAHHSPLGMGSVRLALTDKLSGSGVPQKLPGFPRGGEVWGPFSKPVRGWQGADEQEAGSFSSLFISQFPLGEPV